MLNDQEKARIRGLCCGVMLGAMAVSCGLGCTLASQPPHPGPASILLKNMTGGDLSWIVVAEARKKTDKCLVGGIDHYNAVKCRPDEIVAQGKEAIQDAGGKGLILAPGCTFFDDTPEANMMAMKEAAGG